MLRTLIFVSSMIKNDDNHSILISAPPWARKFAREIILIHVWINNILPSTLGVVVTIISSPKTIPSLPPSRALCWRFHALKHRAKFRPAPSSPLPPSLVFFESLTFSSVPLRIFSHKTSLRVFAQSMLVPTPFSCERIFSHASCFAFFVTVDEKGAKTIILCSLTSCAKSNFGQHASFRIRLRTSTNEAKTHVLKGDIVKFAFVKVHLYSNGVYKCNVTIVIYTCIRTGDTSVNSSVENSFIESLYLQVGLYTCKNYKSSFFIKLTPGISLVFIQ